MLPLYMNTNNDMLNGFGLWFRKFRGHFIAWIIFMGHETLALYFVTGAFPNLLNSITFYAFNITAFYAHALLVMPFLHSNSRWAVLRFMLVLSLSLLLYMLFGFLISNALPFLTGEKQVQIIFDKAFVFTRIWRWGYFIGFATGYYFTTRYYHTKQENQVLEQRALQNIIREKDALIELSNARNAYLLAQVNPHFLYNVLTFIYAHTRKEDPQVGQAILILSKIMRYAAGKSQQFPFVSLADEVEQVKHLMQLSEIIKKDRFHVVFHCDEAALQQPVIPLILLTLYENMFKHGDLSQPLHPGLLSVTYVEGILRLETKNMVDAGKQISRNSTGLENLKQRLTHTYGAKASMISFVDPSNYFIVQISVSL